MAAAYSASAGARSRFGRLWTALDGWCRFQKAAWLLSFGRLGRLGRLFFFNKRGVYVGDGLERGAGAAEQRSG
jgi:hypothetical protein